MRRKAAIGIVLAMLAAGCAPTPAYVAAATAPPPPGPVVLRPVPPEPPECAVIRAEVARQQRIAAFSGVMETALVETAVDLNVSNVLAGLATRAAIEGCRL